MTMDVVDESEKDPKESIAFSPRVTELHLQADDFSQFDGPALSLWHLRQVLLSTGAPRAPSSTMSGAAVQTQSKQFLNSMSAEEGVHLVNLDFLPDPLVGSTDETIAPDVEFRLNIAPQSMLYLSYRAYRVVVCLDASPSTLSIDPVTGTLILDVAYHAVELLLQGLVQRPSSSPPSSSFSFPDIYLSVIVQGAMVDSLCVLVQGVSLDATNVQDVLALIKTRLHLLEDHWAMLSPGAIFSEPTSLSTSLQNATFALNTLPHEAAPMLFLVTDGVVDLPNMYAYDDLMMQLARHNIQCHAIQIGGGYMPHCSFGYVPDTDLLRFVTDATGGALFDLPTLRQLGHTATHPLLANGIQPILFFKPSLVAPGKHAWDMPKIVDAVPLDTLSFRPLRLFREKIHEYKMRGSVLKITQARLQEGFFVSKVQTTDAVVQVQCLLQWKPDIWLEYSITAPYMSPEMTLRVDVMAQAKFLEEFGTIARRQNQPNAAGTDAAAALQHLPASSTSVALHTFLKELHERDRVLLHLMSAIQMQALDHDTKPMMNMMFSRSPAAAAAPAHPVFALLGDLSPLLWHRWFHVDRFELINVEWTKWPQTEPLVVDAIGKWATMQLNPNIFLKFLVADADAKPNVNRKQRGSMTAATMTLTHSSNTTTTTGAASAAAPKKAVCFVRLEHSSSAIVVVHVAFYSAKTAVRKTVLAELKRLLGVDASSLVVSHRHIQRLLLQPVALSWLIAPQHVVATTVCTPPSCCGGSGVSTPVFAASMWHVVWLWHISEPHQEEAIRRLQAQRQEQGLVVLQATPSFVLLVQEVVVRNGSHTSTALFQCAISVVSESIVMTSFWMEPVTGQIVPSSSGAATVFGTPPAADDLPVAAPLLTDTQWFERMQTELYLADVHVLSCLLTFYQIVQATKEGARAVGSDDAMGRHTLTPAPEPLNGLTVLNSPFSAARLLTTCPPATERFLLYLSPTETASFSANQHLHAMTLQSLLRLTDCEVAWTESNPPSHVPSGPLWVTTSSAQASSRRSSTTSHVPPSADTSASRPTVAGRCFAKVVGEYTMLLAFVPALDTLPPMTTTGAEPTSVEAPDERLRWLAGLSSSVVSPATQRMAMHDMAWFEQRKQWMDVHESPSADDDDAASVAVPFDVLPIQFYECSLVTSKSAATAAAAASDKSMEMETFVRLVKAAHEQNFSHGVYEALRRGATIQPCDLLQALWSCVQVPLDVDVTRLHAMLPLDASSSSSSTNEPSALDHALATLIADDLTPIPNTQWYYFTGAADDVDGSGSGAYFVRFECWQDEEPWPSTQVRPRSKSVRVISESQSLTNVLKTMTRTYLDESDTESSSLIDRVLLLSEKMKDVRCPRIYLRLVVMTLPDNSTQQEPKLPLILTRLRNAIQELCAQQVLAILQCLPALSLESPPLGALVQMLFDELPPTSVRRVQYPLSFLPLDTPGLPLLNLFHDHLLSSHHLHLVRCDQMFFVIDGPDAPLTYWAYLSVSLDCVSLHLHIPPTTASTMSPCCPLTSPLDELSLLTKMHLGILATVTQVNQFLLLQQLHETRTCSPLLLAPPRHATPPSAPSLLEAASSLSSFFWPGQFECPCKFTAQFVLKSRLVPHLALNMLCSSALEQFQVHNRHHVFVYRDKRGHVFYMTLTTTDEPTIELHVFGIRDPGDEITTELVRVLEQKLDETLLRILMKALPNMKATRVPTASSRQNKLTAADVEFLVPDPAKPTLDAALALPPLSDSTLLLHFVKDKLVETPYIRVAPPIDATGDGNDSSRSLLSDTTTTAAAASSSSASHAAPPFLTPHDHDAPSLLSFVLNVNPELSGRTGFVAALGKGLAWIWMDVVDTTSQGTDERSIESTGAIDGGRSPPPIPPLTWSSVLAAWPTFPTSPLSIRFRVFVRGHVNTELVHEIFASAVQQALYEYAIETILRRTTQDTPYVYPVDTVAELKRLMERAGQLSATTVTTLQQGDVVPSYDMEHVVKQLCVPFDRLPSYVRPNLFHRAAANAPYDPYETDALSATAAHNFTDAFAFVCPMGVCSKYVFDDDAPSHRLVKTSSSTSLQSVETTTTTSSSPMVSPHRHMASKDVHETMLHASVLSNPRHLFYHVELSHRGLTFTGYNCHPHVLDILGVGFAKALGWCRLRQTLLRSILFQKRGYTLAAPTTCTMLQPSALVVRPPPVLGKAPAWTPRDFTSTLVAFTPQLFNFLLDHNNPPTSVSAMSARTLDGMGLVDYLRETGTTIDDIMTRPRVTSSTSVASDKVLEPPPPSSSSSALLQPITPVGGPATSTPLRPSGGNGGVANNPSLPATTNARKANVPPNATNALMAARARARGVVKAAPVASAPSTTGDDAEGNKLPPAWSLTLNTLAPRSSSKTTLTTAPSPVLPKGSSATTMKPPSLPPRRLSNSEKTTIVANKDSVWRHTLRTLLPSSFSHYNRNERNERLKAKDPLSYHGVKLRSALDFHDAYRTSYTVVYDVFKALMSHEAVGPLATETLAKLLSCGRLMLHRYFTVSFAGAWPDDPPSRVAPADAVDMLTLLSYEIEFIFNAVFATVGRLHVDFLCHGVVDGAAPSASFQTLVRRVAAYQDTLHTRRTHAFCDELIRHLTQAGFSSLAPLVFVKKETEGLVLVELRHRTNEATTTMGTSVRALFVSERDVVSLDAGRHLPQSSVVTLTGDQVVHTMSYVQTLLHVQPMVYDFAVADTHAYLLQSLSMAKDQLERHMAFDATTDLRHVTLALTSLLALYPTAPSGAAHCVTSLSLAVDVGMDVSILLRYIACHAKRYYVGDLLVFGTPNAIAARSATGQFNRTVRDGGDECPYSLLVTSTSDGTVQAFALHLHHHPFETTELLAQAEVFVLELLEAARVDYHRDVLWSRLLCSGKTLQVQSQVNLPSQWTVEVGPDQLEECLALSVRTSFGEIDPVLDDLLQIPVPWTEFTTMLQTIHKDTMREYQFEESRHVLLMCVGARDIMIHIHHDVERVHMEICRREEPPNGMLSHEQRKTLRDFVNHIVYWLWTHIVVR
ncbi:Aste57867_15475 [Aphanomyces stellatus]|uniref:Aste57867_15475 protein n=1 Tax=Aphanomyces stellatus TaxID=120398 RepID=A0A485L378_9STRA|nr:hypothetical protein As57867_015419 [Aphanomyces stellatus]VFT92277.1 Aste57867_15475 [Aphanomyces stellatus]